LGVSKKQSALAEEGAARRKRKFGGEEIEIRQTTKCGDKGRNVKTLCESSMGGLERKNLESSAEEGSAGRDSENRRYCGEQRNQRKSLTSKHWTK